MQARRSWPLISTKSGPCGIELVPLARWGFALPLCLVNAILHSQLNVKRFAGDFSEENMNALDLNECITKGVILNSAASCALRTHIHHLPRMESHSAPGSRLRVFRWCLSLHGRFWRLRPSSHFCVPLSQQSASSTLCFWETVLSVQSPSQYCLAFALMLL